MIQNKLGELRPNQIITTFGPGAIVDAVKDSVIVLDTDYWTNKGVEIDDIRLANYFKVNNFYMPCSSFAGFRNNQSSKDIPVISFPNKHICSNLRCRRIFDITKNFDLEKYLQHGATCPDCGWPAYPSRFITICTDGHMDDFPYTWWVHHGNTACHKKLKISSRGNTSTLADIWIDCECGESRSMSGAMQADSLNGYKCTGRHPFRPHLAKQNCQKPAIPSQRGASNVYFSVSRSAISIPPWINPLYELINEHWDALKLAIKNNIPQMIDAEYKEYFSSYTREEFDSALNKCLNNIKDYDEIKKMEYETITHFDELATNENTHIFKAEEESVPVYLSKYFSRIIKVTRLREVKVLLGFTRVEAFEPDAEPSEQPGFVKLSRKNNWLPAAEINGEGIFIEFNKRTLQNWLARNDVRAISRKYEESYKAYCLSRGWQLHTMKNAKYVLLHTFSHLMIKQMALFSGYSSAAIRERIYFSDEMSGILLYTGAADKEGSLGGLVELGSIEKLITIIKDAFMEALMCSNDFECMNNLPAGSNLNGAACHSCCMVAETACENGNRLLDRGLVVPIGEREDQAYFKYLVAELCQLEI